MNEITFEDVLLDETISFIDNTYGIEPLKGEESKVVESLFFPGCSFLNSSIELIEEVFQTLRSNQQVDGISLMCCEKPLDYKCDTQELKEAFSQRFREGLIDHGVKRIIAACPNCFYELRKIVSQDVATSDIKIVELPRVLRDCGYRVPASTVEAISPFAIHDACPDRRAGHYAESVRSLFPADLITELEHNRSRSLCCGSIPRAAGNQELAAKDASMIYREASKAEAKAIVTSCMSCSRLLAKAKVTEENAAPADSPSDVEGAVPGDWQNAVPIFHYLELLFGKRINWKATPEHLVLRFRFEGLFDQS